MRPLLSYRDIVEDASSRSPAVPRRTHAWPEVPTRDRHYEVSRGQARSSHGGSSMTTIEQNPVVDFESRHPQEAAFLWSQVTDDTRIILTSSEALALYRELVLRRLAAATASRPGRPLDILATTTDVAAEQEG